MIKFNSTSFKLTFSEKNFLKVMPQNSIDDCRKFYDEKNHSTYCIYKMKKLISCTTLYFFEITMLNGNSRSIYEKF